MNGKRSGVLEMSGEGAAAGERLRSKRRLGFNSSSSAPSASWAQAIMQRAVTDLAMALRTAVLPFPLRQDGGRHATRGLVSFALKKSQGTVSDSGGAVSTSSSSQYFTLSPGGERSRRREGFKECDQVVALGVGQS